MMVLLAADPGAVVVPVEDAAVPAGVRWDVRPGPVPRRALLGTAVMFLLLLPSGATAHADSFRLLLLLCSYIVGG